MGGSSVSSAVVIPLLISGCGIAVTGIVIVTYHFVIVRLCGNPEVVDLEEPRREPGFDKAALALIPKVSVGMGSGERCAICLSRLREAIRLLPNCGHTFHCECVDNWLASHVTCPVCRTHVFPFVVPTSSDRHNPPTISSSSNSHKLITPS